MSLTHADSRYFDCCMQLPKQGDRSLTKAGLLVHPRLPWPCLFCFANHSLANIPLVSIISISIIIIIISIAIITRNVFLFGFKFLHLPLQLNSGGNEAGHMRDRHSPFVWPPAPSPAAEQPPAAVLRRSQPCQGGSQASLRGSPHSNIFNSSGRLASCD